MSATPALTRLAEFVAGHPRGQFDPAHVARAADAFLDTLGCMLLGRNAPVTRFALEACAPWGGGPAVVPGTGVALPPPWAALAGGAAAHAYDLDDYTLAANDHPSAVVVPALLAQASNIEGSISGAALLDAYLIGLEVIIRIGEAVNLGHYNQGWHTTSTIDSLGATAAVARLTGLGPEEIAAALSLTTSMGSGFVSQFGTMAKPLHAGISAKSGIVATALARAGATASPHVMDGPVSLLSTMTPEGAVGFDTALAGLGTSWGIDRSGLGAKLYPSCGYTHRCIDGAIELHDRLGGPKTEDIASVDLSLPDFHLAILPYGVPDSTEEALFSAPWCAAVGLMSGACKGSDFTQGSLARGELRALTARMTATARTPINPTVNIDPTDPDIVTVTLVDGRRETARVGLFTGAPGRDLGREGLVKKYNDNCAFVGIPQCQSDALREATLALPTAASLADLQASVAGISPAN